MLEALREAKPKQLFVVADGPRSSHPEDQDLCQQTRALIDEMVDWDCEVHRDFSQENLGCGMRPHTGINWAFQHVEQAIILEDDCVPDPSFFPYCEELLTRYANDERVMHISGTTYTSEEKSISESYFFSNFPACWGWATWKRAWNHYSFRAEGWESLRETDWIQSIIGEPLVEASWAKQFDKAVANDGSYASWDYQWGYSCWAKSGLSIFPRVNLISNVGFGELATHMHGNDDPLGHLPTFEIESPLSHPTEVRVNTVEEHKYIFETLRPRLIPKQKPSLPARVKRKLKSFFSN